ncbi:MAG TPA: PfkB family carbohydrate kinase [Pirellulales bacterium]|jgi:1-phosphofructokinase family hexose kinase|nr:PfkB family carbohydrate kinase [Pirellulales bacterium]
MLLAAGLTPARQQIFAFDHFRPGEVNRAVGVGRCASGKVLNVGMALKLLGCDRRILSVVGGGAQEAFDSDFAALDAPCRWIETAAETRTCITILDGQIGATTELVENAGRLSADELARFHDAFAGEAGAAEFIVLTGSLPAGTPSSFFRELLDNVHCPALLDARGPELLMALDCRPLVVKPNREELAATVGRCLTGDEELHRAMAELNDRGAEWVVVSEGKKAVWVSGRGRLFRLDPPELERIVNPIGCGDVLAAGIAAAIVRGNDPPEAVRFGMAAAAESALELLPARFDPSRIAARLTTITINSIM